MDCILFRHGIAVEADEWQGPDGTRPLTAKGKKKVMQVAAGLAGLKLVPTHLLTSPYVRAKQTAKILLTALCPATEIAECSELLPGAVPEEVVTLLRTLPHTAVVLCVGHEPMLGEIVGYFLMGRTSRIFKLKKSGGCMIHFRNAVKGGEGTLQWWLQPSHLRALGKGKRSDRK